MEHMLYGHLLHQCLPLYWYLSALLIVLDSSHNVSDQCCVPCAGSSEYIQGKVQPTVQEKVYERRRNGKQYECGEVSEGPKMLASISCITSLKRQILKAALILLPLLGLTWVFGLLAVNENTAVFAWLFTIFNSLQARLTH